VDPDGTTDQVSEYIQVNNVGDATLEINSVTLGEGSGAFTISSISTPVVSPGGSAQFLVTYEPLTAATDAGVVYVGSNDPDEGTVEVPLVGVGVAPVIEVTPPELSFGEVYIGCEDNAADLTISNVGTADLVVSGFEYNTASVDELLFDQDSVTDDTYEALPWTIEPGDSAVVSVYYLPYDTVADTAYLFVDSNDPYTPRVMAEQGGVGVLAGSNLDVYEQPIAGLTDIIFAVDRSCSMDDDIMNVQSNFSTFTDIMASLDADFQVAATVDDDGCINGSDLFIDNTFSSSDAISTITAMIALGSAYGSNTEKGFMLLEACLSESMDSSGCNYGLVRDDAKLNLVGISDEPEQSVSNWTTYVSNFQSLKDDPDDVVFHAIGGDVPSGCGSASAYTGYYDAVVATGGLFLSICATDWGSQLEDLAEGSAAVLNSFTLSDDPVEQTIVVRIDGVSTTTGWSYNEEDNSVEFETEYIPEGGSTIEVEYALKGDCAE
jgi:hypothetical protein